MSPLDSNRNSGATASQNGESNLFAAAEAFTTLVLLPGHGEHSRGVFRMSLRDSVFCLRALRVSVVK
jgi:hypothetical protein